MENVLWKYFVGKAHFCYIKELGGRFGYFFFGSGAGKGGEASEEAAGGGGSIKIEGGGGVRGGGVGGGRALEGMSVGRGGGGAKYFFSGPKCPPRERFCFISVFGKPRLPEQVLELIAIIWPGRPPPLSE